LFAVASVEIYVRYAPTLLAEKALQVYVSLVSLGALTYPEHN
jgi:uncharacterized protein YpmS